jgi:hypothetical protein
LKKREFEEGKKKQVAGSKAVQEIIITASVHHTVSYSGAEAAMHHTC